MICPKGTLICGKESNKSKNASDTSIQLLKPIRKSYLLVHHQPIFVVTTSKCRLMERSFPIISTPMFKVSPWPWNISKTWNMCSPILQKIRHIFWDPHTTQWWNYLVWLCCTNISPTVVYIRTFLPSNTCNTLPRYLEAAECTARQSRTIFMCDSRKSSTL